MLDLLTGFVAELRRAGLPVSLTEHLDAAEAVHHIPLEDRDALKYALGATLVKSAAHWRAFEMAFEIYFATRHAGVGEAGEGEGADGQAPEGAAGEAAGT
ncbi:MAG: vWA domain-containing protein, partial [Acidimicrobiales bacterium]